MSRIAKALAPAFALFALCSAFSEPARADVPVRDPIVTAPDTDTTDRMIVKLRDPAAQDFRRKMLMLGNFAGTPMVHLREMSGGAHVARLAQRLNRLQAHALARRLQLDPTVEYVEPDFRVHAQRTPNDPLYSQQWHYYEPAGGINLPAAWDVTTGSSSIVVAVIDTGVLPHGDLASRLLPGYDFISDIDTANDGDGRDADASDPGDYGCNGGTSSWHGTHVAGTIGAVTNNGVGAAGVNWNSKILPVRVLGKCGGFTSDIVDAMRWAAGIQVLGVPVNPNPARVENLSFGESGACSISFQSAVDDVTARGTVVVAAAGNSNLDVSGFQPANCTGVIAVAATTRTGAKAYFTNFGSKVAISAPGTGVVSTLNSGTTVPVVDSYAAYSGTSMATPHVVGVVSLMLSVNSALTPAQVLQQLQRTARTFPTGTGADCTTALCGAGIVDAAAALGSVPTLPARSNWALQSSGATASASSTINASYPAAAVNNGDRRGLGWGSGGGWNDGTGQTYPDWLQINFNITRSINEIDVFTLQDAYASPVEPTESLTFSQYGIIDFEVQYWDGTAWTTVPGGSVRGNNNVWRKFTFSAVSTSMIRVYVLGAAQGYSRIAEIEAYGPTSNWALQSSGATASASSAISANYPAVAANNGDRRGLNWGSGGGWNDGTGQAYPDWLQINFNTTRSINEVDVYTLQDAYASPQEPTQSLTFSQYGITDFEVQYWNGTAWATVPGGSVRGNNNVWRKFTFNSISTSMIRIYVLGAAQGYSRIAEIEAYGPTP